VGIDAIYLLGIATLIVTIARWPWSIVVIGCFSLLLELAEL
jgi:hypothetical protein